MTPELYGLPSTFSQLPGFDAISDRAVSELAPSTRLANGLDRWGISRIDELRDRRPVDFLEVRNVGVTTVHELMDALAMLSRTASASLLPDAPWDRGATDAPLGGQSDALSELVLKDLQSLAAWWAANRPADTLGEMFQLGSEQDMPSEIVAATERLADLRLRDLGRPALETYDPVARVAAEAGSLDERSYEVLRRRSGDDPDTLEAVGATFGLSRERVRQIERKARDHLSDQLRSDSSVVGHLAALEGALRPMVSPTRRDQLLRRHFPGLTSCDEALGRVVADLVLDQVPEIRSWRDGWLVVSDVREELEELRREGREGEPMTLHELRSRTQHTDRSDVALDELLAALDLVERDGIVRGRPRSLNDRAEVALAGAGQPLGFDDLLTRLGSDVNPRSLRNALFQDDRFVRTDRDVFALESWGVDEYAGIVAMITRYLQRQGGQGSQEDIVSDLCGRFSVAESSVRAYASSAYFVQPSPGEVRIRRPGEPVNEKLRPLSASTACVRIEDRWALRLEVTESLLSGYSPSIPDSFAAHLGVQPLQTRALPTELGGQVSVVRKGLQRSLGRLRPVAEELGLGPGALLFVIAPRRPGAVIQFLSYTQDEVVGAEDELAAAMKLAIQPPITPRAVVAALGFDEGTDPADALARLRARSEEQLADRLSPFVRGSERSDPATAADVARLLGM